MKKIAAVLVLVIALGVTPATANPGAGVAGGQMAEADWIVQHGPNDVRYYFAAATRTVGPDGLRTIGVIGEGDCTIQRDKFGMMISCHARGRGKELTLEQFEFDPAMSSAVLRLKSGGFDNEIQWTGRETVPWVGGQVVGGDGFAAASVMGARSARADGKLLGRDTTDGPGKTLIKFGFLSQGADAFVFTSAERNFEFASDGTYEYNVKIRVPR